MSPADEPRSVRDRRNRRPSQAPRRQTPHRPGPRRPPQVRHARLRCRLHRDGSAGTTSFPGVPGLTRDLPGLPVSRYVGQQVPRHNSPRSRPRRRPVSRRKGRTSEANNPRLRSGRPRVATSGHSRSPAPSWECSVEDYRVDAHNRGPEPCNHVIVIGMPAMKQHEHSVQSTELSHDHVAEKAHAGPAHHAHMAADFRKRFWI